MTKTTTKTTSKNTAKKTTSRATSRRAPKRATRASRFVAALPEALRTDRVVEVANSIEDTRAVKEVERALRGAGDALQSFADRLSTFEEAAEERISSLRLRVIDAMPFEGVTFDELSADLSERALKELDDVLLRLGLVRVSVVEDEKKALEKKLRALRKELKGSKTASAASE
jgi:hypothetical protein